MNNKDKIILDLCGGTGAWSRPYKDAGYDVKIITLPDYNILKYKILSETITFWGQNGNSETHIEKNNIYGILAAPPCTEFSIAKGNRPRDFDEGMRIVRGCLEIIWATRSAVKLKFWVLENPRGFLRQFLGKPAFTYEQWEFGDNGIKPTDLWGYFTEPKKTVLTRPSEVISKRFPNGRLNHIKWSTSAEKRAITPAGFAKAFFKANQ